MAGLIFLAILFALFLAALWIAKKLTNKLPSGAWRTAANILITLLLLLLLVADEIVGGFQFRALCEKNAVLKINAEKIKGKTIRLAEDKCPKNVKGTAVRIYGCQESYRDTVTNEELANAGWYVAEGGWFIRMIGFSDSTPPLTMKSSCSSRTSGKQLSKKFDFQFVE